MRDKKIYLSSGTFPWRGITKIIRFAKKCGFDGIELLPTQKMTSELGKNLSQYKNELQYVASLHQSWRLDLGHDHKYNINALVSAFFTLLRYIFFPTIADSTKLLTKISRLYGIPVTVHNISEKWVLDSSFREFSGGINLEIIDRNEIAKYELKKWLKNDRHSLVIDTRDDQSLRWARHNGFRNYSDFWKWVGLKKINSIQLSLIGMSGIRNILHRKLTLAEKELMWLHSMKWQGLVVVEVNPILLFFLNSGNVSLGLQTIVRFVKTTLYEGKRWSFNTPF